MIFKSLKKLKLKIIKQLHNLIKLLDKPKIEKIIIPKLPEYKCKINKELIQQELLFTSYFIS